MQTYKDIEYEVQASTTEDVGEVLLRVIDVIIRSSGDGHPGLAGDTVELWFGQKKMLRSSKLSNYVGRIEKTKVSLMSQLRGWCWRVWRTLTCTGLLAPYTRI